MSAPIIRAAVPADAGWILALNAQSEVETSPLDAARLRLMLADAHYFRVIDGGAGCLLAFDERAQYDSPNFRWVRSRYLGFVYIDRVIVALAARRTGLGRALYEDLFAFMRAAGRGLVACEVNVDPPNAASDAFHTALGFNEVGRATLPNGKSVRYLTKAVE
jgi:hypothetical protein